MAGKKGEFHCPFASSRLRRLEAKGPRNTVIYGDVPRAARAFSALALGWYVSRLQRFCRFAARGMLTGEMVSQKECLHCKMFL